MKLLSQQTFECVSINIGGVGLLIAIVGLHREGVGLNIGGVGLHL